MRKTLVFVAVVAVFATVCFAQNGGHLLINNDASPNSADIDTVGANGSLALLKNVSTGGSGLGGGYFAAPRNAIASNLKCFWVTDAATSDIASFAIPSLKKTGNFTNASLNGDYLGIGVAQAGNYLISAWSGSANLAVLKINADCTLTMVGSPVSQPDNVADVTATKDGKVVVVSFPNTGGAQAYTISTSGTLTALGPALNFYNAQSECNSTGCYPTAQDVTANDQFWVWGNATLAGPYTLSAQLTKSGFTNVQEQNYPNSGLQNVETPWFSPAGRAGNGILYLGASGFGTGYPAGVIVTSYSNGTITYDSAAVNNSAFYAGNVQTIGNTGTGSPVTQIWSDGSANNYVQSYTVSGTTLTPAANLQTTSSGYFAFSTNGVGH